MTPDEQARHDADAAAQERRAREARDQRLLARDLSKLTPEQREDEKLQRRIDAAVEARFSRLVLQNGPGIQVTGGNGNFTIALDPSALSMSGNGVCNPDGTSTFTFKLTL